MKYVLTKDGKMTNDERRDTVNAVQGWLGVKDDSVLVLADGWRLEATGWDDSPLVYLCGTITPDLVHLEWREYAEQKLAEEGIGVLSPVRGKDPRDWTMDGQDSVRKTHYAHGGFVPRDRRDIERCDAMLLHFMAEGDPDRQSIGTWVELGWAIELGTPVVVATDMDAVATHPFVYRHAAKVCGTLDDALGYLTFLLS